MEPAHLPSTAQENIDALKMPTLHRSVLDVSGQPWLPCHNLDLATPAQIGEVENQLDKYLGQGRLHFIHVGRNRFEVVGSSAALDLRSERLLALQKENDSKSRDEKTAPIPSLSNCVVLAGRASLVLGRSISDTLGIAPGALFSGEFANGETRIVLEQSVRDRDVFIVQSISAPVNDSLMELCLTADALRRASARSITAVVPYYGYSRQEKKDKVRGPISARVVADMLEVVGVNRLITLDIHAEAIEGFFRIPVDNLAAFPLMVPHLTKKYGADRIVMVSPDAGGMPRVVAASNILARYMAESGIEGPDGESPHIQVEGMYKKRVRPNEVAEMRFIGDGESARGATCILIDDMLDTAGSAMRAAKALKQLGAGRVVICATHPIFSRGGLEQLSTATCDNGARVVDEVVTTDSLPLRYAQGNLITVVSVKPLLAEAIKRICSGQAASLRELQGFCGESDQRLQ